MGVATAITAAAGIGGAMIGASAQKSAARSAASANLLQQQRALAFQREMTEKGIQALESSELDANMIGERLMTQGMAQAYQAMAARGMQTSTVGLGAQRAAAADAAFQAAQIRAQQGQAKAAIYGQQDFPMIMQQGPQGNMGADYGALGLAIGKMAANAYTSSQQPSYMSDPNYLMHQEAYGGGN